MAISGAPSLDDVKVWLDVQDDADDMVLQESLDAALEAQNQICVYPVDDFGDGSMTADLREAIFIRTLRLSVRRNSPEGVVGLVGVGGDFVAARLASYDADVWALEGPHRRIPVA